MFFITIKFDNDSFHEFNRIATKCIDTCECLVEASKLVNEACTRRLSQCDGFTFVIENVNFSFTDKDGNTEVTASITTTLVRDLAA